MPKVELNARRALKEPKSVTVGEREFTLPAVMPASIMARMLGLSKAKTDPAGAADAVLGLFTSLFGADHAEEAMDAIGLDEISDVLEEAYGMSLPQSEASPGS